MSDSAMPMDLSPPDSSVHGILQARILEWVAKPSSRGSSRPRDRTCVSYVSCNWQEGSLPLVPAGKPRSLSNPSQIQEVAKALRTYSSLPWTVPEAAAPFWAPARSARALGGSSYFSHLLPKTGVRFWGPPVNPAS